MYIGFRGSRGPEGASRGKYQQIDHSAGMVDHPRLPRIAGVPVGSITEMPTRRILVVEDELNVRLTVAQMLRLSGYEVHEAATGDDAVMLARATDLDLVLSDIRLPGIDGYEVFRRIRVLQPCVRGVAMTGFAGSDTRRIALDAGFDCLIHKPFTFDALLQAVASSLEPPNCDTE